MLTVLVWGGEGRAVRHLPRGRRRAPGREGHGPGAGTGRRDRGDALGADLLRADARQHRLPAGGDPAGPQPRRGVRGVRRDRGAERVVHGRDPAPARRRGAAGRGRRAGRGGRGDRGPDLGAVGVPGRRAGRDRRRGLLPAPGDLPSDLPFAAAAAGGPAAAAAAARGRGHRPGRAAGRRAVLRVRRHVRAEEPGGVLGHAGRQDRGDAAHRRGVRRRGRRVLPAAHRRWPVPAEHRHRHPAPGRDPRHDQEGADDVPRHADRAAGRGAAPPGGAVPGRGGQRAGRQPAAAQPRSRHLDDPGQARGRGGRGAGLAGAAGGRRGHQGRRPGAPGPLPAPAGRAGHRARRHGALGRRRQRGEPDRHRPDPRDRPEPAW